MKQQNYSTACILPLDFFLDKINAEVVGGTRIDIQGYLVNISSNRLKNFKLHGTDCKFCGKKGSYFAIQKFTSKSIQDIWHVNLYAEDGEMITADHIIPKSKGGPEHYTNFQTLCHTCNWQKGDKE